MSMDDILKDFQMLEDESAGNTTEPLAAHNILPLVSSLAKAVYRIEQGMAQIAQAKPELQPQMIQLPVQFISDLRNFLQTMAFESILYQEEDEEEDEINIKARMLFFVLESQLQRQPLEIIANQWMKQMSAQVELMRQQMAEEEEEEEPEEFYDGEQGDEEVLHAQQLAVQSPPPLPVIPPPSASPANVTDAPVQSVVPSAPPPTMETPTSAREGVIDDNKADASN